MWRDLLMIFSKPFIFVLVIFSALIIAVLAGCSESPQATFNKVVPPAHGQLAQDTLTWTNPTQWEDGTALTAEQLDDILIQWGSQGGPYNQGSLTVVAGNPGATQQAVVDRAGLGTRCYIAFAVADTLVSQASNEACKTIKGPPKPPTGLAVN